MDLPTNAPAATEDRLSDHELEILAFENRWWRRAGFKEQAIRDRFELSAVRYYQALNSLLNKPAALAHDPLLVGRLLRMRDRRSAGRAGR